ncbi:hypothetical protein VCUG_00567 [Vavraia culicis subsp. floridensis]|uniref:MHD domain-containing protein n=1 Tax=Vavraia culicis (isolate floridensis) TaxID=948595 RepID=L2GWI4_VAVCU|nr:uncharacterized protein VCUG_00567 [Vavraia culicis subsp. floridensis]ELA47984.1 hypothetical protein VCUG_00567 [Vavraia culicis subsp. floridensis]
MMSISVFDKDFTLLYGNPNLDVQGLIKAKSTDIACLEKHGYIIIGHSKELEVPVMLSVLDRICVEYLSDYFRFFTYMDNKFFNGYVLDEECRPRKDKYQVFKKERVKFDVEETIRAILQDNGTVLSVYAQGKVTCYPQFDTSTQLYIQYSIPKTEIEMRHSVKKFSVSNKPRVISSYTFNPVQMPLTLIKHDRNHYVLRSCLSDKSCITVKFPISKKAYNTVADSDIGHVKIMDEHIEWIIKDETFKEAEIKYDFDVLMSGCERLGPVQMNFTSKFFSLSELVIKDVRDSDNVKKEAWVSYIVEAQDYEIRGQ